MITKGIVNQVVDEIFYYYEKFGDHEYGEDVTQLEHMVQSAQLAEKEGFDEEVILAAFLHDIGHLVADDENAERMGTYGAKSHDKIGGDYLRQKGFSEKIAALVEGHVQAKRYLTFKKPSYYEMLSDASKQTLTYQGGKMNAAEAEAFEKSPFFEFSIKMREWDEAAKETNQPLPDITIYKRLMQRHLMQ